MTDSPQQPTKSVDPAQEAAPGGETELLDLGITAHQHTTFEWNGYRYSNARDAVAAARRAAQ